MMSRFLIAGTVFLLLLGCRSTPSLGALPPMLVELYDTGDPSGWMEIEAERDGTIIELEADIPVKDLPDSVRAAAEAALPGATVTGAEREIVGGSEGYEVKLRHEGREYELVYSLEGKLLEKEMSLRRGEAPFAVIDAAHGEIRGGQFLSVERIERGNERLYHVKLTRRGAFYKIELDEDGNIRRKVREARAEIEIPLK